MKKNTAGKWIVFAWTTSTGLPKTGDAANITATMYIDGVSNVVDDTNPTELAGGYYVFDVTATETNGDNLLLVPASGTSGVQVIGVPGAVWTEASYDRLGAPTGASVSADLADIEGKVDDLEGRLTAARAGYLDNLSGGAVALASALATVAGYIDTEVATLVAELAKVPKSDGSVTWNATALAAILTQASAAITAAEPIDANLEQINGLAITGNGTSPKFGV